MNYNYLNPNMLLSNPDIYHEALKFAKEDIENDYSSILNDTTLHYGWYLSTCNVVGIFGG